MASRQLDTSGAAEVPVHLVPALIEHNGSAAVESYFRPRETGATVDGLPVLACSLRGRSLAGVLLPLPAGYSGAVLECRQQDTAQQAGSGQDPGGGAAGGGTTTAWVAKATFSHLHYFNHDAAPLRGDGLRRCLEWADLSAQVHRAIDPAAVVAAVAAGQTPVAQQAG